MVFLVRHVATLGPIGPALRAAPCSDAHLLAPAFHRIASAIFPPAFVGEEEQTHRRRQAVEKQTEPVSWEL